MSARSVKVILHNDTEFVLSIDSNNIVMNHGRMREGCNPPPYIDPGQSGSWTTESNGMMTGTEGHLGYFIHDEYWLNTHNWVYIHWDNPYSGSNSCDTDVKDRNLYECDYNSAAIHGNDATMEFWLKRKDS